ncbi:MAG: PaaI family thioesterase [Pseudomonadales bacterium]|nr:PaaI family thioesterase [Pseudomonadales bacterium]
MANVHNPAGNPLEFNPEAFFTYFDENPFHQYLGLTMAESRPDYFRARLVKNDTTPQGIGGSVNGGVIATMIDMAAVASVFTNLQEGNVPAGTADLNVTYLKQAHGEWVDAEATVIKRGRQLCAVEVKVINDKDELCAMGRVLYAMRSA